MSQEHTAGEEARFERYALYWMPELGSPLAEFGRSWFGYDTAAGETVAERNDHRLELDCLERITSVPRRYGFHATLLPPFRLRDGMSASALSDRLQRFAAQRERVDVGPLQLVRIANFLALAPQSDVFALRSFHAECAFACDLFRAPLSGTERTRRLALGLSYPQRLMLAQWGYPYMLADYRFHLTLTGPLDQSESDAIMGKLAVSLEEICARPLTLESISLCGDPGPGQPFQVLARFPLKD
jgi:hypothetical protein